MIYTMFLIPHYHHILILNDVGPAVGRFGQRYGSPEHFQASMKNYYALISGVDKACKEIVDKLKEEGLYNNTMIIFTTDNGKYALLLLGVLFTFKLKTILYCAQQR